MKNNNQLKGKQKIKELCGFMLTLLSIIVVITLMTRLLLIYLGKL